jgi:hypothetical protein
LFGTTCMRLPDLLSRAESKRRLQRSGILQKDGIPNVVRQGSAECDNPAIQSVASASNENWIEESAFRQKACSRCSLTLIHAPVRFPGSYREPLRLPIKPSSPILPARSRSSGMSSVKDTEYRITPGGFFSSPASLFVPRSVNFEGSCH